MREVAVGGTGIMGKLHLEAWSKLNDCEISAIIGTAVPFPAEVFNRRNYVERGLAGIAFDAFRILKDIR
ncbi:hypothetical protein [Metabacillus hrfriensis]|uniref:Uncharacterized protein n=1 Tax=Metabacillus hrfriensis TaxID=3048891 RepID=A0ACD4RFV5_9BACI|nr:hypothetical protein [Metabacillus sp. CT-WN-B3]USK29956.1 hypothetical protein LIT32_07585 [Bacillus sp. CMF21]WHZ59198.1 hypothetical protein QLQ22_07695 [Metabacillus sp. CT-WN-B3]